MFPVELWFEIFENIHDVCDFCSLSIVSSEIGVIVQTYLLKYQTTLSALIKTAITNDFTFTRKPSNSLFNYGKNQSVFVRNFEHPGSHYFEYSSEKNKCTILLQDAYFFRRRPMGKQKCNEPNGFVLRPFSFCAHEKLPDLETIFRMRKISYCCCWSNPSVTIFESDLFSVDGRWNISSKNFYLYFHKHYNHHTYFFCEPKSFSVPKENNFMHYCSIDEGDQITYYTTFTVGWKMQMDPIKIYESDGKMCLMTLYYPNSIIEGKLVQSSLDFFDLCLNDCTGGRSFKTKLFAAGNLSIK